MDQIKEAMIRDDDGLSAKSNKPDCSFPDCACIKWCADRIGKRVPDRKQSATPNRTENLKEILAHQPYMNSITEDHEK